MENNDKLPQPVKTPSFNLVGDGPSDLQNQIDLEQGGQEYDSQGNPIDWDSPENKEAEYLTKRDEEYFKENPPPHSRIGLDKTPTKTQPEPKSEK